MSRYVIDEKLLRENIHLIQRKAKVPVIGVVKGNGYGFGIKEFTRILKQEGISTFAITEVSDIKDVKSVIDDSDNILVMRSTCIEDEAKTIAENGCIATIGSTKSAEVMNLVSEALGIVTKCHLKIDTGLGRYGFLPSQVEEAIHCYELENINFCGAYTHFSSAFHNEQLTKAQLTLFKDTMEQIKKAGCDVGVLHASNSPALLNVDNVLMDSVRIGSAFTGRVITKNKTKLNRLGMLEAEVIDTKVVPAGYSIGYNGLYKTTRKTKIAIVPIGHYDGFGLTKDKEKHDFHSVLSELKKYIKKQRMYMKINNRMFYVIGEIGLSHTALDITDSDVKVGDKVTVDVSPLMINPKIPRVYIHQK